jgi:UDP-N-acetylmuramoyl-L-alanyl-D-glutamate--2,6-diaminopimelate ligase
MLIYPDWEKDVPMLLHDLLRSFDSSLDLAPLPNVPVSGVKEDSRLITPGDLFIARSGTKTDGRVFLADAHRRGAAAAIVAGRNPDCPLPQIVVPDPAASASPLANLFFGRPSESVRVLGVTGTNGKTTTAYLVRHLLHKFAKRCGLVGTVQIDDGKSCLEAAMTTPSATEIGSLLGAMRNNGCSACAMEVSSHALDQGRVSGVKFAAAAFTNLTGDHLDYHKTMENYAAAKARLFEMLGADAFAIVNVQSPWSARMTRDCRAKIVKFGFDADADYRAEDIGITSQGSRFLLTTPNGQCEVSTVLIGKHNIENILTAAALVGTTFGLSAEQIAEGLRDAAGAPGRLQAVSTGQEFAVLVDYAHTDDALANVLLALRPLTRGRLRVLFGCGGDRDRTKRPRMARVAEHLADVVYVTSDNPRTETASEIIREIVGGFSESYRPKVMIDPDRRRAIARILADAQSGDVVLIAGKGHENYQIIGAVKHHFDDVEEATQFLTTRTRAA